MLRALANKLGLTNSARFARFAARDRAAYLDEFTRADEVLATFHAGGDMTWSLAAMDDALRDLGTERLSVLLQVPAFGYFPPKELILRGLGIGIGALPVKTLEEHRSENRVVDAYFAEKGVHVIDPSGVLCPQGACMSVSEGQPQYYDDDHVSVRGAEMLKPLLAPLFVLHDDDSAVGTAVP